MSNSPLVVMAPRALPKPSSRGPSKASRVKLGSSTDSLKGRGTEGARVPPQAQAAQTESPVHRVSKEQVVFRTQSMTNTMTFSKDSSRR